MRGAKYQGGTAARPPPSYPTAGVGKFSFQEEYKCRKGRGAERGSQKKLKKKRRAVSGFAFLTLRNASGLKKYSSTLIFHKREPIVKSTQRAKGRPGKSAEIVMLSKGREQRRKRSFVKIGVEPGGMGGGFEFTLQRTSVSMSTGGKWVNQKEQGKKRRRGPMEWKCRAYDEGLIKRSVNRNLAQRNLFRRETEFVGGEDLGDRRGPRGPGDEKRTNGGCGCGQNRSS